MRKGKWWRTSPGERGSLDRKWYCAQRVTPVFMVLPWLNPRRDFGVKGRVLDTLVVLVVGMSVAIYLELRTRWIQRSSSATMPNASEDRRPGSNATTKSQRDT